MYGGGWHRASFLVLVLAPSQAGDHSYPQTRTGFPECSHPGGLRGAPLADRDLFAYGPKAPVRAHRT
jgi:hypothetical protein